MTDRATRSALEACGASGPFVLGVEEPGASGVSWRVFDRPFVVVGRDPGSDLVLQDPAISRRHAYFQLIAGRLFCVDLQSRTGTLWGEEPGVWGWVDPDLGVRVGPFRIRPRDGSAGIGQASSGGGGGSMLAVPVSRSFEQAELEELTLELAGRASGSATWRASRALILIGSSPACKIRLVGGEVAPIHAAILRTPDGVFAIDLLGPGGVSLNGGRSRFARLRQGDELVVGGHKIRVQRGSGGGGTPSSSPRPPGRSMTPAVVEDAGSLASVMLEEFARMQDRTSGQLQASLMAIVQSFVGLHQEQMALIREELGQIRALTEEQSALRSRAEARARAVGGSPALRLVSGGSMGSTRRPSSSPELAEPTRPAPPLPRLAIGESGPPGPAASRPGSPSDGAPLRSAPIPDEGEFHARVFDRLAEIQGERQGRWQKLIESLIGRGT